MIEWKRDGEYVLEGTGVKAEYVGMSVGGNAHFVISGIVEWVGLIGNRVVSSCRYRGARIIEKPKTYTATVYFYKTKDGKIWCSEEFDDCFNCIGKHTITAPYGTGL